MKLAITCCVVLLSGCASNEVINVSTRYERSIASLKENERIEVSLFSQGSFSKSGTTLVFEGSNPEFVKIYDEDSSVVMPIDPFEKEPKEDHRTFRYDKGESLGAFPITRREIKNLDRMIRDYRDNWVLDVSTIPYVFSVRHYVFGGLIYEEYCHGSIGFESPLNFEAFSAICNKIQPGGGINSEAAPLRDTP